ncbi:hypothetical protein BN1708_004557 [Verticillium longisporum]|uniref:RTA1 domain-containing protein n=1 Tax=Verticillium longisporum TaxID=100787 RepID=A0A0G4M2P2_VERLO|nr:hypothetical protein BN1708_004557 [Verticillium longisporum]
MRFSVPLLLATVTAVSCLPSRTLSPAPTTTPIHDRREQISSLSTQPPAPGQYFTTTQHVTIPGMTNDHVTLPAKTIDIAIPTCTTTAKPDSNGHVPPGECGAFWNYYPSFAAAAAFAILFAILTATHIWQAAKYKKAWCWVIIMASIWETLAFLFRAISTKHQQSSGIYLVFQIFILLAPIWVNAFAYMTLGRMIHFFHPRQAVLGLPASTLAALFVALDIVSFAVQLAGGSMAGPTTPPAEQMRAIHIYMGGIALQEFFILLFLGLTLVFHRDMRRVAAATASPAGTSYSSAAATSWRPLLWALYVSLAMITTRIVFRLVEFSSGHEADNPLLVREAYFYALEAAPMALAVAACNVAHPAAAMRGPESEMPGLFGMLKQSVARRRRRGAGHVPLERDVEEQELTCHGRRR